MPHLHPADIKVERWTRETKPPEKWEDLCAELEVPPGWKDDEMARKMMVWSAHMYNWANDVKEKVDKNTQARDPIGDQEALDPPPKPPFGGD